MISRSDPVAVDAIADMNYEIVKKLRAAILKEKESAGVNDRQMIEHLRISQVVYYDIIHLKRSRKPALNTIMTACHYLNRKLIIEII